MSGAEKDTVTVIGLSIITLLVLIPALIAMLVTWDEFSPWKSRIIGVLGIVLAVGGSVLFVTLFR